MLAASPRHPNLLIESSVRAPSILEGLLDRDPRVGEALAAAGADLVLFWIDEARRTREAALQAQAEHEALGRGRTPILVAQGLARTAFQLRDRPIRGVKQGMYAGCIGLGEGGVCFVGNRGEHVASERWDEAARLALTLLADLRAGAARDELNSP